MTAEEALNIFKEELQKQEFDGLTGLQEYIFKQSWNHITYEEMSDKLIYGKEYSRQHIKNKGKELFDFISKVVGQKVRKKDFRVPLDNFFKHKNREKSRENAIAENLPDISTSNTEAEIDVWAKQVLKNLKPFYERRHGKVKVLGMREPLELESIYTAIQILDDAAIRSYESIKELERLYRSTNRRSFQVSNQGKRQGIQVANEEQYLMVLGGPGMGKSIFLRKVGLEATKGQQGELKQNCIPVLLELKKFTSSNLNFKDLIVKELEILGVTEANQWITEALESGKLLILLDGLDEVPKQNFRNIKTQIKNFVDRYYKNRFIVSCRLAYLHSLQQFTDVRIADFDDNQIQTFINNWFSRQLDAGKNLWSKLQSNSAAKELTQTPLLLVLLCLVYQDYNDIPSRRGTLYQRAFRVLLTQWDNERDIDRENRYKELDSKRKERLLSQIAHDAFEQDRLFLPFREITDKVEKTLAKMLQNKQHFNGEQVIKSIESQHGVLVERDYGVYSFSHLTLQEYLTAQYILDHNQVEKLVGEHLFDKRWREVFLLVAEMGDDADDLLLQMEKEAARHLNTPRLQALLNWAEEITSSSPRNYQSASKRAMAIAFTYVFASVSGSADVDTYADTDADADTYNIYADADAFASAYVFAKGGGVARELFNCLNYGSDCTLVTSGSRKIGKLKVFSQVDFTRLIDELNGLKNQIPDKIRLRERYKLFALCFQQTLLNAFHLRLDMIEFSTEETIALRTYLDANLLLLKCLAVSLEVSSTIKEEKQLRCGC